MLAGTLVAQTNPVKWSVTTQKVNDSEYDLIFTAEIQSGWYVYSEYLPSDDGPVATSVELSFVPGVKPVGSPKESGDKHEGHDEMFDMKVTKFSKTFKIAQRVSVATKGSKQIAALLTYMCCNNAQCLPPRDEEFTFVIEK